MLLFFFIYLCFQVWDKFLEIYAIWHALQRDLRCMNTNIILRHLFDTTSLANPKTFLDWHMGKYLGILNEGWWSHSKHKILNAAFFNIRQFKLLSKSHYILIAWPFSISVRIIVSKAELTNCSGLTYGEKFRHFKRGSMIIFQMQETFKNSLI